MAQRRAEIIEREHAEPLLAGYKPPGIVWELGRPVRTLRCPEAAALGAALLAGTAVGVYASLEEAVASAVAPDRQFEPVADRTAHYRERWSMYQQVAAALRPLNPLL